MSEEKERPRVQGEEPQEDLSAREREGDAADESPGDESGAMEPAPTDFRRNIWVLVFIVIVVAAAWLVTRLLAHTGETERPAQTPAPPSPAPPPAALARRPPSYKELLERQRRAMRAWVASVAGDRERLLLVSPMYSPATGAQRATVFDVTRQAEGFDVGDLTPVRLPDQAPVLGQAPQDAPQFAPAKDVEFLTDRDRVIVLAHAGQVKAYPTRILRFHEAMRDEIAGQPVLVCWLVFIQSASCLDVPPGDKDVEWGISGLVHRGNMVLYDRASGSLWDAFAGVALAGPRAGAQMKRRPVSIHAWPEWQASHPEAQVLTQETGHDEIRERDHYSAESLQRTESYLADPNPLLVPNYDPGASGSLGPKAFVLGVTAGGQAKAYPLEALWEAGKRTLEDQVGEQKMVLNVGGPRTGYAADTEGRLLDAAVMLWFAWRSAHPDTQVWKPPGD